MEQRTPRKTTQARRIHSGRPPKLPRERMDALRIVASEHPNATVAELCRALADQTGVLVTPVTMYRYLHQAGIRRQPRSTNRVHRGPRRQNRTRMPAVSSLFGLDITKLTETPEIQLDTRGA